MGLTSGKSDVLLPTRLLFIKFTRFFDDIELLRQRWQSTNTETVAELYAHHSSLPCRCHLIIADQARRLLQILLSRVFIWSGGHIYPRWFTEERKQGLVN